MCSNPGFAAPNDENTAICSLLCKCTLFQGDSRVTEGYLDQWLIILISHLFASDSINETLSTFLLQAQTLSEQGSLSRAEVKNLNLQLLIRAPV